MQAEHLGYADVVAGLKCRVEDLVASAGTEPDVAALQTVVAKLFDDLAQHVQIEETVRFPMFEARPAS